jgi:hypothetical protein
MSKYRLEFTIQELPPTFNAINRKHWGVKKHIASKWRDLVVLAVGHKKPPQPLTRAELTLTRHSSNEPDFDGLTSCFKHPIDGLIDAQVIVDDKMSVIGQPTYRWEYAPRGKGKITVTIEGIS